MAKTDNPVAVEKPAASKYPKDKLLESKQYGNRRDALSFLLKDGETYTIQQVDKILADFMKGKVN